MHLLTNNTIKLNTLFKNALLMKKPQRATVIIFDTYQTGVNFPCAVWREVGFIFSFLFFFLLECSALVPHDRVWSEGASGLVREAV